MKYVIGLVLFTAAIALALPLPENRVKIAVIDTGVDLQLLNNDRILCNSGHKSFTKEEPLEDVTKLKHGTNVAGLVAQGLDVKKYCLLILKISKGKDGDMGVEEPAKAVDYAVKEKVKFINLSIAAPGYFRPELTSIRRAALAGIVVVVAAGNDAKDLGIQCDIYPACYKINSPNFKVVGSSTFINKDYSNYGGPVNRTEDGTDVGTPRLSGTSQATAIYTNKLVKGL